MPLGLKLSLDRFQRVKRGFTGTDEAQIILPKVLKAAPGFEDSDGEFCLTE